MNIKIFTKAYKYFTGKDVIHIWEHGDEDIDFLREGYDYYVHIRHIIYYMRLPDGKTGIRKGEVHRFILN